MGSTTIVRSEPLVSRREETIRPGRENVREQLDRLLASPLFNHSKHYPSLLRYVVNETLEGRGSHLKERALGVEVFNRDPDYDTNADPVVRTSACEVRKRIAQYYHEPGHETEIRIDLPSGSYVPEFRFAAASAPEVVDAEEPAAMLRLFSFVREGRAAARRVQVILAVLPWLSWQPARQSRSPPRMRWRVSGAPSGDRSDSVMMAPRSRARAPAAALHRLQSRSRAVPSATP